MSQPFATQYNPWDKPCQSIWPLSSISLKRNLKREPFPHRQEALSANNTLALVEEAIKKCPLTKEFTRIDLNQLSPDAKEALFTRQLLDIASYEDRPSQALFSHPLQTFVIGINLDNHLCLHALDYHNDWFGMWNKLVEIDNFFAKQLDYAFSTRFGYLTKNIQECGLGLNARACLHLPLLTSKETIDQALLETNDLQLSQHPDFAICELKNRYNLGLTEETLMQALHEKAQKLTEQERTLREQISQPDLENVKKTLSTSLGILLHGYGLSMQEMQHALSYIKLGLDLKLITGISDPTLNHLFFQRPSKELSLLCKESLKNLTLLF